MPRQRKPAAREPITLVIIDCRSAKLDRRVPLNVAKALYNEGKLHWDLLSSQYCVPETGRIIHELLEYPVNG